MAEGDLEIGGGLVLPASELRESASRAGGPGGQHVNKTSTRVTLRWNARSSVALDPTRRAILLERLGSRLTRDGDLIVHVGSDRSRSRNREAARERLAALVADALQVPRPRVETRPTRASRQRRITEKRRRSGLKRGRQRVDDDAD